MSFLIVTSIGIVAILVIIMAFFRLYGTLLRKVGPNEALIIYGTGGTKAITGGSHFVIPLYQRAQSLSLEVMSFELPFALDLSTPQERIVNARVVVLVKVRSNEQSVRTAAEHFLSKSQQDLEHMIRLVIEGHLYGIIDQAYREEQPDDLETIGSRTLQAVTTDLEKMGLEIISFTIKPEYPLEDGIRDHLFHH